MVPANFTSWHHLFGFLVLDKEVTDLFRFLSVSYKYSHKASFIATAAVNVGMLLAFAGIVVLIRWIGKDIVTAVLLGSFLIATGVFLFVYVGQILSEKLAKKWTTQGIINNEKLALQVCLDNPALYPEICRLNPAFANNYVLDSTGKPVRRPLLNEDVSYINRIQYVKGAWHQYDVQLAARPYSWKTMVDMAAYLEQADLGELQTLTVSRVGTPATELIDDYRKSGTALVEYRGLAVERGTLAVGGISRTLNTPVKLVWINQTNVMQVLTPMLLDDVLIEQYLETLIRRTFGTSEAMKRYINPLDAEKAQIQEEKEQAPQERTGMQSACLTLGIIGFLFDPSPVTGILAIIFGFISMPKDRRQNQKGFAKVLAGIILGALIIIKFVLFILWCVLTANGM